MNGKAHCSGKLAECGGPGWGRGILGALLLGASVALAAPANITVDGEVADWKGIAPAGSDPKEGASPCDWRKAFLASDREHLFVRYTTEDAVDFNRGAAYMVLLDVDQDKTTGFQGSGRELSVGADFLLQGATLYAYGGTGTEWAWESVGTVSAVAKRNEAECAVPLDRIRDPKAVDVIFYGDNETEAVGGKILDLMPDAAATSGSAKITHRIP